MSEEPVSLDPKDDSTGRGVGQAILMHAFQLLIVPVVSVLGEAVPGTGQSDVGMSGFFFALAFWSVTQFLYLGPAAWYAHAKGRPETMKGILIVAGLGVLLNGGCDALLFIH